MIPFYVINGLLLGSSLVLLAHSIAVLHGVLHRLYEIQERLRMLDENLDSHDRLEAERFERLKDPRDPSEVIHCIVCKWYRVDAASVYGQCLLHDLPREDFDFCSDAKEEAGKA